METIEETKNESTEDKYTLLWVLTAIVVVIWIVSYFWLKDDTQRGTFGDMFGGVNALFSGLAFAGVIFTIFLQKRELGLQREELKATREEFVTQNDTLSKQRFENTFFQLLSLHHEIIDHMTIDNTQFEKREALRLANNIFGRELQSVLVTIKVNAQGVRYREPVIADTFRKQDELINLAYSRFNEKYDVILSHYFRNLYHIFKFIHLSQQISEREKHFYSSIVRAQLSPDELLLIMYNSLIDGLGYPNFLYLIREYNILKNLNFDKVSPIGITLFEEKLKIVPDPFSDHI